MKKIVNIVCYACLMLLATSCYTRRVVGLLQERNSLPEYDRGVYQEYRLRKNDELTLRIISADQTSVAMFGNAQTGMGSTNNMVYRIYDDGTVDIPFLSRIPLEGMTLEEAEKFLTDQMKPYIPDVQVKLALSTSTFCVIGDAGRGYFNIYKERLTIFQALALCGGVNESGDIGHVKIVRETNEGTKIVSFDLRSKSLIDSEYYYIYPNDIIYVDVTPKRFWAVNSYSGFLGVITSSLSLLLTVWNLVVTYQ
ncbi:MAG: polysaccharide biosynthesis/export family protein [Bacteroidales bacterium]|nr:polysaccharide biosynthesis/export family protein [Bacteroidales bacterium]